MSFLSSSDGWMYLPVSLLNSEYHVSEIGPVIFFWILIRTFFEFVLYLKVNYNLKLSLKLSLIENEKKNKRKIQKTLVIEVAFKRFSELNL